MQIIWSLLSYMLQFENPSVFFSSSSPLVSLTGMSVSVQVFQLSANFCCLSHNKILFTGVYYLLIISLPVLNWKQNGKCGERTLKMIDFMKVAGVTQMCFSELGTLSYEQQVNGNLIKQPKTQNQRGNQEIQKAFYL